VVVKKGKAQTPAEKARRLRFYVDGKLPVSHEDEVWLKAYEAAEAKRLARKQKLGEAKIAKAEEKAKKEGRSLTMTDLNEAMKPTTPNTRMKRIREGLNELTEVRAALDHAFEHGESLETLAHARALALAGLPRNRTKARQVTQLCKIGKSDWLAVTYTAMVPGVDLAFGADLLAIIAIVDRVHRTGQSRLEFSSLRDLVASLESSSYGGKTAQLALERLMRAAATGIAVTFYGSEDDARAARNHYRAVTFTVVRDWWAPGAERQREALFEPYIEVSQDLFEHLKDPKSLLWVPVEVVRALSTRPLTLQLLMLIYPRAQSTKGFWEMPFEELMGLLNDTGRRERDLIRDIHGALLEIRELTGNRLQVRLVEAPSVRDPAGGRPKKRWALRFGPSQSLTRKPRPTLGSD
jgi:hypothetical protein